jgi:hypothetical protein
MSIAKGLKQLGFENLVDFSLRQDTGAEVVIERWSSATPQPTKSEIETAEAEWQAEQDATQYQRDRQAEYPSIDELDRCSMGRCGRRTHGICYCVGSKSSGG